MSDINKTTILIIDDEKFIRQSYAVFLEDLDYRVLAAENGRIGLEIFQQEKVDLVLVDLRMPEIDGLEVLARITKMSPETPMIVVSGTGIIGDAVEALRLGAWDYLLKPIEDFKVLLHAVTNALEKARLKNENRKHQEHLETMVAERTSELKLANEDLTHTNSSIKYLRNILRNIVNSMPSILIGIDHCGNVIEWNQQAEDYTGLQSKQVFGRPFTEVFPQLKSEAEKIRKSIDEFIPQKIENFVLIKDGTKYYNNIMIYPLTGQEKKGVVVRIDDVTENVQLQNKILKLNENLEKKIAERTRELEKSLDNLKEVQTKLIQTERVAALGNLVVGVAHEINTPLGVGITAITYLQEKTSECLKLLNGGALSKNKLKSHFELLDESCAIIFRNLENMVSLIDSFKQVAVDQISENRREFNVKSYLEDIILSLKPKFKRTQHVIEVNGDNGIVIDGYPGILSQIITNLIVNSLIHGFDVKEDGSITINFSLKRGNLELEYTDNGKGMSAKELKQIFDPFFTTKRSRGGTGLGMHIVYNLITQKLNGSISCESVPENGIKILFSFPV